MDRDVIIGKETPLYRPLSSDPMLRSALDRVQRWENPLQTMAQDVAKRLDELESTLKLVANLVTCLPLADQLMASIDQMVPNLSQVPQAAANELEVIIGEVGSSELLCAHLDVISKCFSMHMMRCRTKAIENILIQSFVLPDGVCKSIKIQLRQLYRNVYEAFASEGIDLYALDTVLDGEPVDLVEWLFELRLYEALVVLRGSQWFQNVGLGRWFRQEAQEEATQTNQPTEPFGDRLVIYSDLRALGCAVFDTQLSISALFGGLATNWHIKPDTLAATLASTMHISCITDIAYERLVASLLRLQSVNQSKFEMMSRRLAGLIREMQEQI